MPLAPFSLVIFRIGSHFIPGPRWIEILLFVLPGITGMMGVYHHTQPLVEMGVSQTFCPGWPQTLILPISASNVARIIGVSHHWVIFHYPEMPQCIHLPAERHLGKTLIYLFYFLCIYYFWSCSKFSRTVSGNLLFPLTFLLLLSWTFLLFQTGLISRYLSGMLPLGAIASRFPCLPNSQPCLSLILFLCLLWCCLCMLSKCSTAKWCSQPSSGQMF
jgi:hypothetical protein